MNHLEVTLAARAYRSGRDLRTAQFRHRRLVATPLAVALWQLGAEPFSPAAVAWGNRVDRLEMVVAGEPRNRELAFAALLRFARWFNPRFEEHGSDRERFTRGDYTITRTRTAPQVLVANSGTIRMLGNLGRRLAYLPTTGTHAADPALVRLGRHLLFLWDHSAVAGQQLVVSLTDLLTDHWATPQSELERQSLAALDAWIEPPDGEHCFMAAARAETQSVGPVPAGEEDERLHPLVEYFNEQRRGSTAPATVGPLLLPIEALPPADRGNVAFAVALPRPRDGLLRGAFVVRRWDEDRDAYTRHMDWMAKSGLRRTRQTPRQAALLLHRLERAQSRLEAEEACDDPLRMVPYLLQHKAVRGRVVKIDRSHRELVTKRAMPRPLVTLCSDMPCLMPVGKDLYWSEHPDGMHFVLHEVRPTTDSGSQVTIKLTGRDTGLPAVGAEVCFSIHSTDDGYFTRLPDTDPWTHQPAQPLTVASLEDEAPKE